MHLFKKALLVFIILFAILAGSFFYWVYLNHVAPILMYHQVVPSHQAEAAKVRPEIFEKHMRLLRELGYEVISLEALVESINEGQEISRKRVVITFDDGYEDNYTYAFPILKKYGYPAIIFIPTAMINTPGYLTWDQIKEMMAHQITFGSHSVNHEYLPILTEDQQRDEIHMSKKVLEETLGTAVDYFAYPIGGFEEVTKKLVKEAGYKAALTTNRGYDPKNHDVFELNRVRLSNSDQNDLYIWVKYAGYSNVFRTGKKSH
jgi:peptidoglycan/xylan/chitin deacetylase (PgdA/CDA1 family)